MTREIALLIIVAVTLALIGLGVWAWRRRTRRDAALTAPYGEIPDGATTRGAYAGFYVATTGHGEPLERLAIRGMAFRSRVEVTVTDRGIALDLTGQPRLFLPADRITEVAQATVAIDRVVEKDGLVRVTWRVADRLVDSYLRAQDASARTLVTAIADAIADDRSAQPSTTPTGTDA